MLQARNTYVKNFLLYILNGVPQLCLKWPLNGDWMHLYWKSLRGLISCLCNYVQSWHLPLGGEWGGREKRGGQKNKDFSTGSWQLWRNFLHVATMTFFLAPFCLQSIIGAINIFCTLNLDAMCVVCVCMCVCVRVRVRVSAPNVCEFICVCVCKVNDLSI